jgi:hypothetical protein
MPIVAETIGSSHAFSNKFLRERRFGIFEKQLLQILKKFGNLIWIMIS